MLTATNFKILVLTQSMLPPIFLAYDKQPNTTNQCIRSTKSFILTILIIYEVLLSPVTAAIQTLTTNVVPELDKQNRC